MGGWYQHGTIASHPCGHRLDLSPSLQTYSVEKGFKMVFRRVAVFFSRTDLGIPRVTCDVNLPEPERSEKDQVLSIP